MPLERETSRVRDLEDDDAHEGPSTSPNNQDNKRRRLEGGNFPPGSIMRVTLKNFVTYTAAEFYPGPNMNLVIGPNGSGKSTIVCAICLGLGYSPNVLGRATALGDYVQHGKETAEIEIELAERDNKSIVIKRKLKKDKNQSTYYVNGKQDTLAKVQETMTRFNIQIDNLCQFLPQDRVASFAQLNPTQLLHETQRAVGGEEMVKHWERLCSLRAEARDLETAIKNDAVQLTNLNQRQNTARVQVERLQRRNEILTRIENLKFRIPIAKYTAATTAYRNARSQRAETKIRAEKLREEVAPTKKRTDAYEARAKALKRKVEDQTKASDRIKKKIREHEEKAAGFETEENDLRLEITAIKKRAAERKNKFRAIVAEIEKLERAVRKCQEAADAIDPEKKTELEHQLSEIGKEKRSLRLKVESMNRNGRALQDEGNSIQQQLVSTQRQLTALTSVTQRRMEMLKQKDRDAYEVVVWLQNEGHKRFKGEVFGPPMLSVNVKDKSYAGFVEAVLQGRDSMTFTCQSREDYKLFTHLTVDNKENIFGRRLQLTAVEYGNTKQFKDWTPPCSDEKLRELGFEAWLLDCVTGPEPVLNMLCHSQKIHALAISRQAFQPRQHAIVEAFFGAQTHDSNAISAYIAGNIRYALTRSRYGKRAVSTLSNTFYNKSEIFSDSIDLDRKRELEQRISEYSDQKRTLEQEYRKSKDEEDRLHHRVRELDEEKAAFTAEVVAINNTVTSLQSAQTRLAQQLDKKRMAEEKPDTTEEELAKIHEKQVQSVMERVEHALAMEEYVKEAIRIVKELTVWRIRALQADADVQLVTAEAGQASQELADALDEYRRISEECDKLKQEAKDLNAAFNAYMHEKDKSAEEVAELIAATPESVSVEQLETELEGEEAALRANQAMNTHGVLEMFEKRAKDIQEIEERMATRQTDMDQKTAEITRFRQIWEPRLDMLINRVSAAFGNAFASIGCAGEVLLSKSGDAENPIPTDDFEKWAIHVKVKFRDTEALQLLTGQRQSGGERSVSTIFYLMALQDMAQAPFRVVDEINQGMDPRNERLVHERMVDAACRPDTSQYFLITPKLLPGLKYHRNMKVLTINNGKFVPQTLDVGSYIQRARALQDVSS